jgi:hypothetical protein
LAVRRCLLEDFLLFFMPDLQLSREKFTQIRRLGLVIRWFRIPASRKSESLTAQMECALHGMASSSMAGWGVTRTTLVRDSAGRSARVTFQWLEVIEGGLFQ